MDDLQGAHWRKSSRSNNGGNCVEVAGNLPNIVGVRDSKDPAGPVLTFAAPVWTAFLQALKDRTLVP